MGYIKMKVGKQARIFSTDAPAPKGFGLLPSNYPDLPFGERRALAQQAAKLHGTKLCRIPLTLLRLFHPGHSQTKCDIYTKRALAWLAGQDSEPPPVDVRFENGVPTQIDGHHRLTAYRHVAARHPELRLIRARLKFFGRVPTDDELTALGIELELPGKHWASGLGEDFRKRPL